MNVIIEEEVLVPDVPIIEEQVLYPSNPISALSNGAGHRKQSRYGKEPVSRCQTDKAWQ